jgi:hypothetical protein
MVDGKFAVHPALKANNPPRRGLSPCVPGVGETFRRRVAVRCALLVPDVRMLRLGRLGLFALPW